MHIPERMCIACRSMKPKPELLRVVNAGGNVVLDISQKHKGRGAYICKNRDCINAAKKRRAISRHFKTAVADDVYAVLEAVIDGE